MRSLGLYWESAAFGCSSATGAIADYWVKKGQSFPGLVYDYSTEL